MPHPTPHERLAGLSDFARSEAWVTIMIEQERRKTCSTHDRCGCDRATRWSTYCVWCWREMLGVLQGWT